MPIEEGLSAGGPRAMVHTKHGVSLFEVYIEEGLSGARGYHMRGYTQHQRHGWMCQEQQCALTVGPAGDRGDLARACV